MLTLTEDTCGVQVEEYSFKILHMHVCEFFLLGYTVLIPWTVGGIFMVFKKKTSTYLRLFLY